MEKLDMNNKINDKTPIYLGVSFGLIIILILSFFYAVTFGSMNITSSMIYKIIINKLFNFTLSEKIPDYIYDIVWLIRLPRIVLAILVGIGLAISGVIMQAVVKNPLADPYILGMSSGASLGATLAIMLGIGIKFGSNYIGFAAFFMSFIVSIIVLILANLKGKANSTKLILAGMAISSLCSAFSSFIIYTSSDREGIKTVTFWLMGSFSGAKWENIIFLIPIISLAVLFFLSQHRTLNIMLLGDDVSITLGKDLIIYRQVYLLVISIVIGFLVFNSGIIGFVGLIIPHIARLLFGTDHKKIIPISALLGSILLIWADVISRVIIKGSEIPVGIIISLIGAPCFIYLMISKTYGFGGKK